MADEVVFPMVPRGRSILRKATRGLLVARPFHPRIAILRKTSYTKFVDESKPPSNPWHIFERSLEMSERARILSLRHTI